ncbi:MAG: ABC transporter substrate-binding protein [Sulfuricurvum sp.]|uniref:ABC transporter substrate-binding protein n=1 Tax=Sulfuricurvum sp. TaxID=2025608 RepID=UPI0025D9925C|nr:ABC transporter substrate-binding protein [Sulfuricurvum sp.]MBV5320664.1 ABC transporter substrate-binding protein [Sulfuricurvum sp.]
MQKNIKPISLLLLLITLIVLYFLFPFEREHKNDIVFGSSAALSGPLQDNGIDYTNGIACGFKAFNDAGGIQNRHIKLRVLDDQYEPFITRKNIDSLMRDPDLFGILGVVGTPTSEEALKITARTQIPFLMPLSGAEFLYNYHYEHLFTLRPSYADEARRMVHHMQKQNIQKIAIFYQNDSYGLASLYALQEAVRPTSIKVIAEGVYNRNTLSIHYAFNEITKAQPDAVVIGGALKPTVEFIRKTAQFNPNLSFYTFSFVGYEPLRKALLSENLKNIPMYMTQTVPPLSKNLAEIVLFKRLYKHYYPLKEPTSIAFEGYLASQVILKALSNSSTLSRSSFEHALSKLEFSLVDRQIIRYSKSYHRGLQNVYLLPLNSETGGDVDE